MAGQVCGLLLVGDPVGGGGRVAVEHVADDTVEGVAFVELVVLAAVDVVEESGDEVLALDRIGLEECGVPEFGQRRGRGAAGAGRRRGASGCPVGRLAGADDEGDC